MLPDKFIVTGFRKEEGRPRRFGGWDRDLQYATLVIVVKNLAAQAGIPTANFPEDHRAALLTVYVGERRVYRDRIPRDVVRDESWVEVKSGEIRVVMKKQRRESWLRIWETSSDSSSSDQGD